MMNARFQESGRYTDIAQTRILTEKDKNIIDKGSSKENPKLIPSFIIITKASTNSRNGQTNTNSKRDAAEAPTLLKSETNKWRADAAIATLNITIPGSHNQEETAPKSSLWTPKSVITNQEI
jgi:hypothetical protein